MSNRTVTKLKRELLEANVKIAQLEKEIGNWRQRVIDARGREDDLKLSAAELLGENESLRLQLKELQEQAKAVDA